MRKRNGERRRRRDTVTLGDVAATHQWSTAVRITHMPTGIAVSCKGARSQLKNREFALKQLRGRLAVIQQRQVEESTSALTVQQRTDEWDSPIRSYIFEPSPLVKDHRTNAETGNIIAVMEGEIDPLIQAYLPQFRNGGGER
jgi:peptide chain release factor 2